MSRAWPCHETDISDLLISALSSASSMRRRSTARESESLPVMTGLSPSSLAFTLPLVVPDRVTPTSHALAREMIEVLPFQGRAPGLGLPRHPGLDLEALLFGARERGARATCALRRDQKLRRPHGLPPTFRIPAGEIGRCGPARSPRCIRLTVLSRPSASSSAPRREARGLFCVPDAEAVSDPAWNEL